MARAATEHPERQELKNTGYEIFIGLLSILSILNLVLLCASDSLWYTIVTISTVGYGDQYPVTNAGRLMGVLIIVMGVGIFGTFTGYLANLFLSGPDPVVEPTGAAAEAAAETPVRAEEHAPAEQADLLREQVRQLRSLLDEQQKSIDAFDRLLQTKGS